MPGVLATTDKLYRKGYLAVNYRLRSLAGGRWARYGRPTSIALLLTKRCQAQCVHCDIWKLRGREDTLSLDEWKKVLTDLRRWLGPVHVVITGGEALLRPYATEVVAHGSTIGLYIEFLTNGYWKDQARIEGLALAHPGQVTLSLDGIGKTHSRIRGRDGFFEQTDESIRTLLRMRREHGLDYDILLKTVIMEHNLNDLCSVARYAAEKGITVLYQPIEQNYESGDDPEWYLHSPNWPSDPAAAVSAVERLVTMQREGYPIANSPAQFDAMIRYFQDPAGLRIAVQNHNAHETRLSCSAFGNLQINPNGDVLTCWRRDPVGNIRHASLRRIWEDRPRWWENGCCQEAASPFAGNRED